MKLCLLRVHILGTVSDKATIDQSSYNNSKTTVTTLFVPFTAVRFLLYCSATVVLNCVNNHDDERGR